MSLKSKVAKSYADAIIDAAEAKNLLAAAVEEVAAFSALVAGNAELRGVFANPAVTPDDKSKLLEALLAQVKPMPLVANFLRVLLRNNRLQDVESVNRALAEANDARRGIVSAEVTTAAPLTGSERAALESKLAGLTGKNMKLEFKTDPELIGGVVTRIGSVIYDGSIRTKLDTIKRRMAGQAGM